MVDRMVETPCMVSLPYVNVIFGIIPFLMVNIRAMGVGRDAMHRVSTVIIVFGCGDIFHDIPTVSVYN